MCLKNGLLILPTKTVVFITFLIIDIFVSKQNKQNVLSAVDKMHKSYVYTKAVKRLAKGLQSLIVYCESLIALHGQMTVWNDCMIKNMVK